VNLQALHRDGQTFITWREVDELFQEDLPYETYDKVLSQHAGTRYRTYRHGDAITASTLAQAKLVAELGIGSGYNRYLYGNKRDGGPKVIRRFVVERNAIQNCARGIGFGLGPDGPDRQYPDSPFREIPGRVGHLGGIIRNNVIWSGIGRLFDSGIGLEQAHGVKVYHNTVYAGDGFSSIDARFPNSNPLIKNNLVSLRMTVRDGGRPSMEGNVDSASADMFVDAATGDLRLRAAATQAIDRGVDVRGDVPDDVSGHARDATPDLGAHEYVAGTGRALSSASSPRRP
jgi:hypothetical protein